ncbi:hypothetical protein [Paraferrimonas haliotis]|uniref:Uncharacterized protein n=1 Tax=Paraferrimonas haliotis TaxID=2013866 RepID=A0AA37TMT4_9GAMM|nr:hypothetical protein [Paraferrimonas haliotis]GLS83233.1 hypothetical protein GCM10007894_12100 [Paraferrimonas haliotis]
MKWLTSSFIAGSILFALVAFLFVPAAFAEVLIEDATRSALATLFSESTAALIIAVISIIGYSWTMLRATLSPELLARAPKFVVMALEFLAGNFGKSQNLDSPLDKRR